MKKTTIVILVGLMLFSGVALAQSEDLPSPGMNPGSPFFFMERFFEGFGGLFTFGQAAKAERAVMIAEKRLSEARALAEQGGEHLERALELYESKMAEAAEWAENSKNMDVLNKVSEATSRHFAVLTEVAGRVPEQAREAVLQALEASGDAMRAVDAVMEAQEAMPSGVPPVPGGRP